MSTAAHLPPVVPRKRADEHARFDGYASAPALGGEAHVGRALEPLPAADDGPGHLRGVSSSLSSDGVEPGALYAPHIGHTKWKFRMTRWQEWTEHEALHALRSLAPIGEVMWSAASVTARSDWFDRYGANTLLKLVDRTVFGPSGVRDAAHGARVAAATGGASGDRLDLHASFSHVRRREGATAMEPILLDVTKVHLRLLHYAQQWPEASLVLEDEAMPQSVDEADVDAALQEEAEAEAAAAEADLAADGRLHAGSAASGSGGGVVEAGVLGSRQAVGLRGSAASSSHHSGGNLLAAGSSAAGHSGHSRSGSWGKKATTQHTGSGKFALGERVGRQVSNRRQLHGTAAGLSGHYRRVASRPRNDMHAHVPHFLAAAREEEERIARKRESTRQKLLRARQATVITRRREVIDSYSNHDTLLALIMYCLHSPNGGDCTHVRVDGGFLLGAKRAAATGTLGSCCIDDPLVELPAVVTSLKLQHLDLSAANMGDVGAVCISNARCDSAHANRLRTLRLSDNNIGEAGAAALGQALAANPLLSELYLHRNPIPPAGVVALAQGLRHNKKLRLLALSQADVGDAGAAALGQALRHNDCLRYLYLDLCAIGEAGGRALFKGLLANRELLALDLSHNALGLREQADAAVSGPGGGSLLRGASSRSLFRKSASTRSMVRRGVFDESVKPLTPAPRRQASNAHSAVLVSTDTPELETKSAAWAVPAGTSTADRKETDPVSPAGSDGTGLGEPGGDVATPLAPPRVPSERFLARESLPPLNQRNAALETIDTSTRMRMGNAMWGSSRFSTASSLEECAPAPSKPLAEVGTAAVASQAAATGLEAGTATESESKVGDGPAIGTREDGFSAAPATGGALLPEPTDHALVVVTTPPAEAGTVADAIAKVISSHRSLRHLGLAYNQFNDDDVDALLSAFPSATEGAASTCCGVVDKQAPYASDGIALTELTFEGNNAALHMIEVLEDTARHSSHRMCRLFVNGNCLEILQRPTRHKSLVSSALYLWGEEVDTLDKVFAVVASTINFADWLADIAVASAFFVDSNSVYGDRRLLYFGISMGFLLLTMAYTVYVLWRGGQRWGAFAQIFGLGAAVDTYHLLCNPRIPGMVVDLRDRGTATEAARYVVGKDSVERLKLIESLLEATPQTVVTMYAAILDNVQPGVGDGTLLLLSVLISIASISIGLAIHDMQGIQSFLEVTYQKRVDPPVCLSLKDGLCVPDFLVVTTYRVLEVTTRVALLTLFAVEYGIWTLVPLLCSFLFVYIKVLGAPNLWRNPEAFVVTLFGMLAFPGFRSTAQPWILDMWRGWADLRHARDDPMLMWFLYRLIEEFAMLAVLAVVSNAFFRGELADATLLQPLSWLVLLMVLAKLPVIGVLRAVFLNYKPRYLKHIEASPWIKVPRAFWSHRVGPARDVPQVRRRYRRASDVVADGALTAAHRSSNAPAGKPGGDEGSPAVTGSSSSGAPAQSGSPTNSFSPQLHGLGRSGSKELLVVDGAFQAADDAFVSMLERRLNEWDTHAAMAFGRAANE